MTFRRFEVSNEAVRQAQELGLNGDQRQKLALMARQAAPCTHAEGNRRFEGWWLRIVDGQVAAVGRLDARPAVGGDRTKQEAKLRVQKALALQALRKPEIK